MSSAASIRGEIAARERWAREPDRKKATEAARSGLRAKFAREVDPDGTLDPAELEYRVEQKHRAHMLKMSLAANESRARKRAAKTSRQKSGLTS